MILHARIRGGGGGPGALPLDLSEVGSCMDVVLSYSYLFSGSFRRQQHT